MKPKQTAQHLIEHNDTLILATADNNGKPWISPLGYIADEAMNVYWVSSKDALHSKNVRANGMAAISIFGATPPDGDVDGIYLDAAAQEMNTAGEVESALAVYSKLEQPDKWMIHDIQDLMGEANWRLYKATPSRLYVRVDRIDESSGQSITAREEVQLG